MCGVQPACVVFSRYAMQGRVYRYHIACGIKEALATRFPSLAQAAKQVGKQGSRDKGKDFAVWAERAKVRRRTEKKL